MATRKYVRRTIQEKNSLLEKYDQLPPMSQNAAARLLNISGPLLRVWLRKRTIKTAKSKLPRSVFSSRKTPLLEAAIWRWIDTCLVNGITVNDSLICKKATQVATEMGLCDFSVSSEWLTHFKNREAVIREMFDAKDGPEETKSGNKSAERVKEHNINLIARKTHRMEAALWRWIDHSLENGIQVNESTIRSKADRLARTVGYRNFRANTDWFTSFKNREGVIRGMFQISQREEPSSYYKKTAIPRMDLTYANIRQLEGPLSRWIDHSRENGITVNESMLRSEATRLARMMGFRNFRLNGDWLRLFKTQPSENTPSVSEVSPTNQSNDESEPLTDLDIPKLDPTVMTAELNGDLHSVTVPSLWQMKEAMKTLATGLLYRGFCDFKLLHQFEKEVDNVVRRSVNQSS